MMMFIVTEFMSQHSDHYRFMFTDLFGDHKDAERIIVRCLAIMLRDSNAISENR